MFDWSKIKNQDILINFFVFILILIGLIGVFSTTYFPELTTSEEFLKQLLFILIGIALYVIITAINPSYLQQGKIVYGVGIIMIITLASLLLFGVEQSETNRWIVLGPITIQPSEFAKVFIVILTAFTFKENNRLKIAGITDIKGDKPTIKSKLIDTLKNRKLWLVITNILIVASTCILVWMQPSLGNTLLILFIWGLMLISLSPHPYKLGLYLSIFLIGTNLVLEIVKLDNIYTEAQITKTTVTNVDLMLLALSLLLVLIIARIGKLNLGLIILIMMSGIGVSASFKFGWENLLTPYQRERIESFAQPANDPLGDNWQVTQAQIARNSGGIFGKGFLNGSQTNSGLLPFAHTDFIFSSLAEQFGLVGSSMILVLYLGLLLRILRIAQNINDKFGKLICTGVAMLLLVNVVINIGMNLQIMPVTGVPLPFVSYGGSAVIVNFIGLGLVQAIYSHNAESSTGGIQIYNT